MIVRLVLQRAKDCLWINATQRGGHMLSRELVQAEIPGIFSRFGEVVNEKTWLDQTMKIALEAEAHPELRDYLIEENRVVIALAECSVAAGSNRGLLPLPLTLRPQYLEALVFAWRVVQLADAARQINNKRHSIFVKRVREALRTPHMLKAMQMEATIATHFVVAGRRVLFPEMGSGSESYDLLVEDLGPKGLEIECKVVTADKGRKIHVAESRELLTRVLKIPCIQHAAEHSKRGLAIRVTVPKRLPDRTQWDELCRRIANVVLSGTSNQISDGSQVRLFDFDPSMLGVLETPVPPTMRAAVDAITGAENPHFSVLQSKKNDGGIVVVVLDSEQPDSMLHELFQTFEDSAGRQLTGKRPGALFATFEDIGAQKLLDLGSHTFKTGEHSALEWRASAFLEKTPNPHVVGVGFLSQPDYSSPQAVSSGTAFWIPKPVSPQWHPSFSGIFGIDPRTTFYPKH